MDVSLLIRHRLQELGLEQKDLASACQVTESYISQLLARKKAPPSPGRTGIYEKIGKILQLPSGELSKLAELQRKEELRKRVAELPPALFEECRELVLRKCDSRRRREVRRLFEKEAFGELERLVTQKLLDVAQDVARQEQHSEAWLRLMAELTGRSPAQVREAIQEFFVTDVFHVSQEDGVAFLDQIVDGWDIDLKTFAIEAVLNRRLTAASRRRFEFAEKPRTEPAALEPGLAQFLQDASLSGDATVEEVAFLKALPPHGKRPSPIYYYRMLQNLRDPLHFLPADTPGS